MQSEKLLSYLQQAVDQLLEQEEFENGWGFRKTQRQALEAYQRYLYNTSYTVAQRLEGFFEMATGVGKTAVFSAIIGKAHQIAEQNGDVLRSVIVDPTRPLIKQTRDDFIRICPSFNGKVGLYGDGNKDLEKPVTIITYNSWIDLSQRGELGSHNVDILISDESHKGTSYRRVRGLTKNYNARTARLAYTATAHFDTVKSVRLSHKREIFAKPLKETMEEGAAELTSYVQAQTMVIRVPPNDFMRSPEYDAMPLLDRVKYRRELRQEAWNKYALEVFKNGVDIHTREPLSDNQTLFCVDGINQANRLELLLNSDEELRARTRRQKRQWVSAAIHSRLPSYQEAEHRFESYKRGEGMAAITDEMLKEGIDHGPIKTIVDYSHGSIVDKLQILGRGTRSWWNDAKDRHEGLTFVDTIIYIGDDNPKADKVARNRALRAAVMVKDLLGGDFVLNPGEGIKQPSPSIDIPPQPPLFEGDPNIQYFTTAEELFQLDNEIEKLRQGLILTMDDIIEAIEAYREINEGDTPTQTSGDIREGDLAGLITWSGVNSALPEGRNSLKDDPEWQRLNQKLGDKNLTLYTLLIELGYRAPPLTMALIVETIDAYRAAHEGQNPKQKAGDVMVGPLAGLANWAGLNSALSLGANGLKDDPEWQRLNAKLGDGNLTLPTLLTELGYRDAPIKLTMPLIVETINAYREIHEADEQNPGLKSGDVEEGPLAGLTNWRILEDSLRRGAHGLKDDPEWQRLNQKLGGHENLRLHTLLIELGYKAPSLTMSLIVKTIDSYRAAHEGRNPIETNDTVENGPLTGLIKWYGVSRALKNGANGLKGDPEWQRLNEKLGDGNLTLHTLLVELGYKDDSLRYTMNMIVATIDAYRLAHSGQNPKQRTGDITVGPLAKVTNWGTLSQILTNGRNGLKDDPEWQKLNKKLGDGKLSLPTLLTELGYKHIPSQLTIALVVKTIDAYREAHEGQNPNLNSGDIEEGPMAGVMKWGTLNDNIKRGIRGSEDELEWRQLEEKYGNKLSLTKMCQEYPAEQNVSQAYEPLTPVEM